jgi:hypothetical protein
MVGKILNLGFFAIIIAALTRYLVSKNSGIPFSDIKSMSDWEFWVYGVSIFWFFLAVWNLGRRRCPDCKSTKHELVGSDEIDRWVGTKTVRVKVGDHSHANHVVSTTYVRIKNIFQCRECGHTWSEVFKREKT